MIKTKGRFFISTKIYYWNADLKDIITLNYQSITNILLDSKLFVNPSHSDCWDNNKLLQNTESGPLVYVFGDVE